VASTQPNWRIHLVFAILAVGAGIGLRVPPGELAVLVLTIGLVLTAEIFNTAVEAAVDAIGPGYSSAAKHAKDAAAGAVLVAAATSVVVGLVIFVPRIAALV
jgi:diacylglycerol kinase